MLNQGSQIGDCLTDTFTLTSPGNRGSPVICGFNSGQHSKLDLHTLEYLECQLQSDRGGFKLGFVDSDLVYLFVLVHLCFSRPILGSGAAWQMANYRILDLKLTKFSDKTP